MFAIGFFRVVSQVYVKRSECGIVGEQTRQGPFQSREVLEIVKVTDCSIVLPRKELARDVVTKCDEQCGHALDRQLEAQIQFQALQPLVGASDSAGQCHDAVDVGIPQMEVEGSVTALEQSCQGIELGLGPLRPKYSGDA